MLEVDFRSDDVGMWEGEHVSRFQASKTGTIHAILTSWEVYAGDDDSLCMATHPDVTLNNFPRDMQWGQGIQLIEDRGVEGDKPTPFRVLENEWLELVTRFSGDGVTLNFELRRLGAIDGGLNCGSVRNTHVRFDQ